MKLFIPKLEAIESRISPKSKLKLSSRSLRRAFDQSPRCFHNNCPLRISTSNPEPAYQPLSIPGDIELNSFDGRPEPPSAELPQWGIPRHLKRELRRRASMGEVPPMNWTTETLVPDKLPPASEESAAVCAALRAGNPHKILDAILSVAKGPGGQQKVMAVITRLPPPAFTELLRCLNPDHFVSREKKLQMEISPGMSRILGLVDAMDQDGIYTFCKHFLDNINLVLDVRTLSYALIPSDFKYLLQCARATGHVDAARAIWANFHSATTEAHHSQSFDSEEFKVDVESYNNYLGVLCWHDSLKPHQRYRRRFIPRNSLPRSWSTVPYTLSGHTVGDVGIKHQATRLFRQMVNSGLSGNEETFCLMMVALGREGDMAGVATILKRVWEINPQELEVSDDPSTDARTKYTLDSPFYPSTNLLFTIAHIYGANNDVPTALRLVDFVSRKYSMIIPNDVWNELLQWTYVLSTHDRRSAQSAELTEYDRKANEVGKLPLPAVLNLWKTMTSEPYSVNPTIEMYNRLIMTLARLQQWGEMQFHMTEALKIYRGDSLKLHQQQTLYNTANSSSESSSPLPDIRAREMTHLTSRVARNKEYIRKWVSLLLLRGSRSLKTLDERYEEDFAVRAIPKIIDTWHMFLKRTVRYHVRLGVVEFGTKHEKSLRHRRLARKYATTDSNRMEHWIGRHWSLVDQKNAKKRAMLDAKSKGVDP